MIIKNSKNNFRVLSESEQKEARASSKILNRMEKLANGIKNISPKSDDFLYFSIIFLKSAEASIYDESGEIKKLASGEKAWGYFDENWKWHGNVKPHRNNNSDIFPESELKKAASKWVGLPLCRDHESSSVDGIRGIILDTYYDEKFKQVVGLCALDRVNYPELARKVETGIVRFGSMGTAVERSICYECCNIATTPDEYCSHIQTRASYGEVNVGLKPIEYSLVVQPAEPGAILLKCIASLNSYKKDFSKMGIENVDEMIGSLNEKQAEHLDKIMKSACGENGCSIEKRDKIVRSFLNNNGIIKKAEDMSVGSDGSAEETVYDQFFGKGYSIGNSNGSEEGQAPNGLRSLNFPNQNKNIEYDEQEENTVLANSKIRLSIKKALEDIKMSRFSKRREAKRKLAYMQGGSDSAREPAGTYKDEGASANSTRNSQDKQMQQSKSMGSPEQIHPGDLEIKQKLSRAQLRERSLRRRAHAQGASNPSPEPSGTYKDEGTAANSIRATQDKQMQQSKSMGGIGQLFPGDLERKTKISRARRNSSPISKSAGYTGPSLKTRLLLKKRANGSVDRKNSVFQVFAGGKKVISVKASDIYGEDLNRNWRWLNSREYGQEVCKEIRAGGINYVKSILKTAQAAPEAEPAAPEGAAMPPMEMPPMEMPDLGGAGEAEAAPAEESMPSLDLATGDDPEEAMPEEAAPEEEGDADKSPSELIDEKLVEMENIIFEIQDLKAKMEDENMANVNVDVNLGNQEGGPAEQAEQIESLATSTLSQLKVALSELDQTADEMAMVSETYENMKKLTRSQQRSFVSLASDAYDDSVEVIGQSKAILSMAKQNYRFCKKAKLSLEKTAQNIGTGVRDSSLGGTFEETNFDIKDISGGEKETIEQEASGVNDLIKEALELRKAKREAILKSATNNLKIEKERSNNQVKTASEKTSDIKDELMERREYIKTKLSNSFAKKQAENKNDDYKVKIRRAYDLALDMQKKGLISGNKASLDRQVDDIMNFDSKAFEAFKRAIANTKSASSVKLGSDLGGLNIGSNDSQIEKVASRNDAKRFDANSLSKMWDK